MSVMLTEPVTGPAVWYGRELARDESWIYRLSPKALAEVDAALQAVKARGLALEEIGKADFQLPTFAAELTAVGEELEWGRGFVLLRGLPAERYTAEEFGIIFWGIGCHFGAPTPQNGKGDLLGHVRDEGRSLEDRSARGYQTRASQGLHVDRCDIVGLLCLQTAKSGGVSLLVSSMAIYNEMLRRCPWYVGVLYKGFATDMRGEEVPGGPPVYYRPVYSYFDGRLTCGFNYTYIRSGQEKIGQPLSAVETEALDAFYEIAYELALPMSFERGDIQLVNNYVLLHDRTEYEDYPEPERRRHLLRLWLSVANPRKLAPGVDWHYLGRTSLFHREVLI